MSLARLPSISRQRLRCSLFSFIAALLTAANSASSAETKSPLRLFGKKSARAKQPQLPTTLPSNVRQLLITTTSGWNSHRGQLWVFHKPQAGSNWQPALFAKPIPVLLGRKGLAWGRGSLLSPVGPVKKERDGRAPAGCFSIGKLYGYSPRPPTGSTLPYHQVGQWDAWPDDPGNPFYNRHVVINPRQGIPSWFEKQKMRHGDFPTSGS